MGKVFYIVIVAVVLAGAVFFFSKYKSAGPIYTTSPYTTEEYGTPTTSPAGSVSPASSPSTTASPSVTVKLSTTPSSQGTGCLQSPCKTWTITYTSQGVLSVASLEIGQGDTVKFVNQDSAPHWPASDPHPTHTICPGFDALRGLATGQSYSYTFDKITTCPFHDHFDASNSALRGQIMITSRLAHP